MDFVHLPTHRVWELTTHDMHVYYGYAFRECFKCRLQLFCRSIWDETKTWESSWSESETAHRLSLSENGNAAAHVAPGSMGSPALPQPSLRDTAAAAGQGLLVRPTAAILDPPSGSDTSASAPDQDMPASETALSPAKGEPPLSNETSEADSPSLAPVRSKDGRGSWTSGGLGLPTDGGRARASGGSSSLRKETGHAVVTALSGPGKSTGHTGEGVMYHTTQGAELPIGDAIAPASPTSPTSNSSAQGDAELAYALMMFKTKWGLAPASLPVGSRVSRADTGVNSPTSGGAPSPADTMAPTLAPAGGPGFADPCATALNIPKVHVAPWSIELGVSFCLGDPVCGKGQVRNSTPGV
jgi:hypothetical protein